MIDNEIKLNIPLDEKLMIYPEPRKKFFLNLLDNYKVFFPKLKLIYATLNWNSEYKADYVVVFETEANGTTAILFDIPVLYTDRSIPAYRYICKVNNYSQFFAYCSRNFCQLSKVKFNEFIPAHCGLSINPRSPLYWKNPSNVDKLIPGLLELMTLYRPTGWRPANPPPPSDKK